MKNVKTLAIAGAMLAAMAAPAQAEVVINDSSDFLFFAFVPCAAGGAGEFVELSGPLHELVKFTINGNNVSGSWHFQPQGISGVGLSTGDTYHATGVTQYRFKDSLQNGQFNTSFVNNFRIIGQGSGNNFLVHQNSHLTINANGDVTSTQDNQTVECR